MTNNQQYGDYLGASEAARLLGVKPATLYAYVSRGLLESVAGERGRKRRYRRADLERLRFRRSDRSPGSALRYGEPLLDSSITELTAGGPVYRGRAALELAAGDTAFERVAELLFSGELPPAPPRWPEAHAGIEGLRRLLPRDAPPGAIHPLVVAALAPADAGRYDLRPEAVLPRARRIIKTLAASLAFTQKDPKRLRAAVVAPTVAEAVALALGTRRGRGQLRAINRLLVLLADHELNPSTFAARVAASTGADPYAAVLAGLATLSGPRHGAAWSDRVEALVAEVEATGDAGAVVYEREQRGEIVPGFGHRLYPEGDPRAALVLASAEELGGGSRTVRAIRALIETMAADGKPPPNLDVAAVALRASLGMPRRAVAGLFAVGRCAGWIAHVLEQYEAGFLLRPRARFRPAS